MAVFLGGTDPEKDYIYTQFIEYFNNPRLYFSPEDSVPHSPYIVYVTPIHSMLLNENRFLIVMCKSHSHSTPSSIQWLKNLKWTILQTRHIEHPEKYVSSIPDLQSHSYTLRENHEMSTWNIQYEKSTTDWSKYKCPQYPQLQVFLLHQRGQLDEYAKRGSVTIAIETFRTLIQLEDTDYSSIIQRFPSGYTKI